MYATPVVYSVSLIPEQTQWLGLTVPAKSLYALNPMVGVIEGFRCALLGTREMPWGLLGIGALTATAMLFTGALFFRHKERVFADVA